MFARTTGPIAVQASAVYNSLLGVGSDVRLNEIHDTLNNRPVMRTTLKLKDPDAQQGDKSMHHSTSAGWHSIFPRMSNFVRDLWLYSVGTLESISVQPLSMVRMNWPPTGITSRNSWISNVSLPMLPTSYESAVLRARLMYPFSTLRCALFGPDYTMAVAILSDRYQIPLIRDFSHITRTRGAFSPARHAYSQPISADDSLSDISWPGTEFSLPVDSDFEDISMTSSSIVATVTSPIR